jgi:hypothetical protein
VWNKDDVIFCDKDITHNKEYGEVLEQALSQFICDTHPDSVV